MNKEIKNDDYKKILLDMMDYIDDFCKKNGIQYYLFWGTLLGAIRHKGFIPWDDDLDIIIPRDDFVKFCNIFNDKNSKYRFESYYTNPNFTAPLGKVIDTDTILIQNYGYKEKVTLGAYVDVFVLDKLPNEYDHAVKYQHNARLLTKRWMAANHVFRYDDSSFFKDVLRYIYYLPAHILGYEYYLKKIDCYSTKYSSINTNYYGNLAFTYSKDVFNFSDFKPIKVPFEDREYYVPEGYINILNTRYGDWQKLPPEEWRSSDHNYVCYWKG